MSNNDIYLPTPVAVLVEHLDSILNDAAIDTAAGVPAAMALNTSLWRTLGHHAEMRAIQTFLVGDGDGTTPDPNGPEVWNELVLRTDRLASLYSSASGATIPEPVATGRPAATRPNPGTIYVGTAQPVPMAHPLLMLGVKTPSTDHPNAILYVGDARTATDVLVCIAKDTGLAAGVSAGQPDCALIGRTTLHHLSTRRRLVCRSVPATLEGPAGDQATFVYVFGVDQPLLADFFDAVRASPNACIE